MQRIILFWLHFEYSDTDLYFLKDCWYSWHFIQPVFCQFLSCFNFLILFYRGTCSHFLFLIYIFFSTNRWAKWLWFLGLHRTEQSLVQPRAGKTYTHIQPCCFVAPDFKITDLRSNTRCLDAVTYTRSVNHTTKGENVHSVSLPTTTTNKIFFPSCQMPFLICSCSFCFLLNNLGAGFCRIGKLSGSSEPLLKPSGNCSFTSTITVLAPLCVNMRKTGWGGGGGGGEKDAESFDYHKLIIKKVSLNPSRWYKFVWHGPC